VACSHRERLLDALPIVVVIASVAREVEVGIGLLGIRGEGAVVLLVGDAVLVRVRRHARPEDHVGRAGKARVARVRESGGGDDEVVREPVAVHIPRARAPAREIASCDPADREAALARQDL
jgi:hypothetical protein